MIRYSVNAFRPTCVGLPGTPLTAVMSRWISYMRTHLWFRMAKSDSQMKAPISGHASPMTREEVFVRTFVTSPRRQRFLQLVARPTRRPTFIAALPHFKGFDERLISHFPSSTGGSSEIEAALRSRGAPITCYVMSECSSLDGHTVPLGEALEVIIDSGLCTIICCIPGQLAIYEGETADDRLILERPAT